MRDGVIVEIGEGLEPGGEHVIDATGAFVTPGLIDSHTHYDLEMFWDPSLDPLPSYGMTTIVMGNCGLGIAPVRDDVSRDIADLLCFIEELPTSRSSSECVPWSWSTWSEYHSVASQTPLDRAAVRVHRAQRDPRDFVMGHDAWEREATTEADREMVMLLEDALAAGSLGMSTNWFDTDRNRELVPSRLSNDAELDALIDVLARHPHATLQVIARGATDRRRVLEKSCTRGVRCLSLGDGVGGVTDTEPRCPALGGGDEPFSPLLGFESIDRGGRGARRGTR